MENPVATPNAWIRGLCASIQQTTITPPVDQHSIEINDTLSNERETLRLMRTRIGPRGEIGWEARDGEGSLLETGHGIDGAGEATMDDKGLLDGGGHEAALEDHLPIRYSAGRIAVQ